jgi:hypothetical protein
MEGDRAAMASLQTPYFQAPTFQAELAVIRKRSQRLYRGYHRLTTSPLLSLYTDALRYVDETMRAISPEATVDVIVDSFGDSHGIDELSTVESMKSLAGLERTGSVKRVVDSDESPLVQAADLIGYSVFRRQMIKYGHIVADEPFMRIVDDRSGESLT